jgi:hypothetical protein
MRPDIVPGEAGKASLAELLLALKQCRDRLPNCPRQPVPGIDQGLQISVER